MSYEVGHNQYLRNLKDMGIEKILYGACGMSQSLEDVFGLRNIVYMDTDAWVLGQLHKGIVFNSRYSLNRGQNPQILRGDIGFPPFKKQTFDGLFLQDIHADEISQEMLSETIKTVKLGKYVIISERGCGAWEQVQAAELMWCPELVKLDLPFFNRDYSTFQRIS